MGRDAPRAAHSLDSVEHFCAETFVRHAEFFLALGSTNDRAAELAGRSDIPMPALVVARRQTAGRGRGANPWWADEGALTFSLLLDTARLGITPRDWPRLSLTTAIAVCDALRDELTANPQSAIRNPQSILGLKWPNDVLIDGRKVCGILIESPGGAAPAKDRLIVGIGINVNNSWQDAPPEAGPSGTSLCDVTGQRHDLQHVLVGVLGALEHRLKQLAHGDPQLPLAWQQLNALLGKDVAIEINGRLVEGKCAGIADDGALLIETSSDRHRVLSGTVNWQR